MLFGFWGIQSFWATPNRRGDIVEDRNTIVRSGYCQKRKPYPAWSSQPRQEASDIVGNQVAVLFEREVPRVKQV